MSRLSSLLYIIIAYLTLIIRYILRNIISLRYVNIVTIYYVQYLPYFISAEHVDIAYNNI